MKTLLLSKNDVAEVITLREVIDAVEQGYRALRNGRLQVPGIVSVTMPDYDGESDIKSCYNPENDRFSVKIIAAFYRNGKENTLPTTIGNLLLFDGTNGVPLCIMDGSLITGMRTGAAGAISAKYMARSDAKTVAVIGGGTQARMQVYALREVLPVENVRVYSPAEAELAPYKAEVEQHTGLRVTLCRTAAEAMEGADIAISTTPATHWLVDAGLVRPGMHIVAVGADMEGKNEWDPQVFRGARIVNDSKAECMSRGETRNAIQAGVITEADIFAEIGEIVSGEKPGRLRDDEVTIFDTVGLGVQDNVTGARVYELAKAKGLGTTFAFL